MPAQQHRCQTHGDCTPYEHQERSPTPPADEEHDLDTERSPLPTDARQLTCMVALSWSPRTLTNTAAKLLGLSSNKLYFTLHDELDHLQPNLPELLAERDGHFMRNLTDGRNGAKAEDNFKVKNALPHLREWNLPLVDQPKTKRGLVHPECAFLLSPLTVDWNKEEEKHQFIECSNPPMESKRWCRFLWPDGKGDLNHPSRDMFKSQLLVNVANVILRSPSSMIPTARVRPNTPQQGRKGITVKYKLMQVTTAFLAYVAVMTHFALSVETTFDEDGTTFNYREFYLELRKYLEAPKFQRRAKVLIEWWNKTLFPDAIHSEGNGHDDDEPAAGSMLALLEAELEADGDEEDTAA
ncbi:hypothetical protein FRC10_002122 [Ceratobasidium sp. 414]|nr:hypothetical protein FRC10_002122 [Ceratobasidium sp. 414]